ncbi:hypothetical protein [uncultured Paraglaciecola sp.]|uniref:hypothetical protein n=1 Tax=uncultured Paraglaciecola sp. TaxID=1765024 RepID=UPI0030D8545D|tara:strand:+ start:2613 stop:2996 length:384 start_codon:yes stop_codon:yes gene_type:complete
MASVHAISNPKISHFDSVSVFNQKRLQTIHSGENKAKWSYLIADNIAFTRPNTRCIKLKKPTQAQMIIWLEKLITADQCANIYVEQLQLDEMNQIRLTQLCAMHNVNVVNLMTQNQASVIKGPWLNN